jgi:hypothetical protein
MTWFITTKPSLPPSLPSACLIFIPFFRQFQLSLSIRFIQRMGRGLLFIYCLLPGSIFWGIFRASRWSLSLFAFINFFNLRTQLYSCLTNHKTGRDLQSHLSPVSACQMACIWPNPER